jgi:hypothetical protein
MTRPLPLHWTQVLFRQDSVIARWQALAGGMTKAGWQWKLERGTWTRLGDGVALAHSGTPQPRQRSWAAVLHAGCGARLSGDAGLAALGVTGLTIKVHDLVIPPSRTVAAMNERGLTTALHRTSSRPEWELSLRGLPVMRAQVAVLHAAAWAKTDQAAEARLCMAVQQRFTVAQVVREALVHLPRLPRRALIREVLDDIELGAHARSELQFLRFCRSHGVPEPDELQVRVRAGGLLYLDGRYAKQKVSVELDGAHHMEASQWNADAVRSLRLAVARQGTGEQLIRLTSSNLRHDAAVVAALLRSLLL